MRLDAGTVAEEESRKESRSRIVLREMSEEIEEVPVLRNYIRLFESSMCWTGMEMI